MNRFVYYEKLIYTQKTVSLNQRKISLIYDQRKNFFELKKVSLIQKNCLWSKKIDFLHERKLFWINNTFFNP